MGTTGLPNRHRDLPGAKDTPICTTTPDTTGHHRHYGSPADPPSPTYRSLGPTINPAGLQIFPKLGLSRNPGHPKGPVFGENLDWAITLGWGTESSTSTVFNYKLNAENVQLKNAQTTRC